MHLRKTTHGNTTVDSHHDPRKRPSAATTETIQGTTGFYLRICYTFTGSSFVCLKSKNCHTSTVYRLQSLPNWLLQFFIPTMAPSTPSPKPVATRSIIKYESTLPAGKEEKVSSIKKIVELENRLLVKQEHTKQKSQLFVGHVVYIKSVVFSYFAARHRG